MIVDGIHENYRVDAFQRPLLPFFCDGENLVRDTAYGRVGHLYAVDIPNMGLNIRRGHAFGVHGQDLLLDVLTDAGLILLQELRLKLPLSVPRDRHLHIAEAGAQGLAAVSVPAVVCVLVFVVVPALAQFVVQLRIEAVFHEFGNRLLEQSLDVVHAADVRQLQQLTNLFPAGIFFRAAFPSCPTKTSILVLLLYTTFEVYTKYGMVSAPCTERYARCGERTGG